MRARLAFLLLFVSAPGLGADLSGLVTEVQDGDSVILTTLQATYKVRLVDIDAPELAQRFGKESRSSLRELCLLKKATAQTAGEDRYGRALARVTCAGVDANATQVRRGMAWVFIRYAPKHSGLYGLEQEARGNHLGVWQDVEPVPPWEWRRAQQ